MCGVSFRCVRILLLSLRCPYVVRANVCGCSAFVYLLDVSAGELCV